MASRQYRRNRSGQFASKGDPGAKVTIGRAGGFANAAHRANVANARASSARRKAIARAVGKKTVQIGGGLAAGYAFSKIGGAVAGRTGGNPAVTKEAAARTGVSMREYKKIYKTAQAAANATRARPKW